MLNYSHEITEADKAIIEECPELNKSIGNLLKSSIGGAFEEFQMAVFFRCCLNYIYEKNGREGLKEAEKIFINDKESNDVKSF